MKLVMCIIALALSLSCGAAQTAQVKQVAYDCATVDIGKTIPEIGMTVFQKVIAIIQAGTDGWIDKLLEIGTKYGEDVLACAAKAAYDAFTAHPIEVQAQARSQTPDPSVSARRAQSFISAQGFSYK